MCHYIERREEKRRRWAWHEAFCEVALHQSAKWTLGKGFPTPICVDGMGRKCVSGKSNSGFPCKEQNSFAFHRVVNFDQVNLPLKGSSRYDTTWPESVIVPQRASNNTEQGMSAMWGRRPRCWGSDLAWATYSWRERSNSFRSPGKSLSSLCVPGELGLFVTMIWMNHAAVHVMTQV